MQAHRPQPGRLLSRDRLTFPGAHPRHSLHAGCAELEFSAEGVVLVMHPDLGMGVEFSQTTEQQREQLEKFIHAITNSNGVLPELMIEPEGLETTERSRRSIAPRRSRRSSARALPKKGRPDPRNLPNRTEETAQRRSQSRSAQIVSLGRFCSPMVAPSCAFARVGPFKAASQSKLAIRNPEI